MSDKRLIETAFPLAEASAASLHEKNIRHGHISTLHLWPARRPLAASRAAVVAALLPDPGEDEARKTMVRRLGGKLKLKKQTKAEAGKKIDATKVEGDGGILWWGQENLPDVAWFREQIRSAHGGRAPRVLDPFAGGGAIPLEAMRLGCEVVANDLNPVAWLVLKCTLEYPQRLAGQTLPLPPHAMRDAGFASDFLKAQGMKKGPRLDQAVGRMTAAGRGEPVEVGLLDDRPWERAGLGWHVRAWGHWVLAEAKRQLAVRYPTYVEWQTLDPQTPAETKRRQLLPPGEDTQVGVTKLNSAITAADLRNPKVPRWVAKPTVAYLWARTVPCKSCRATIPLLKTRWLCKTDEKRVVLEMAQNEPNDGVTFSVRGAVPVSAGNSAQRRVADKAIGGGTMSRAGVTCPCCFTISKSDDIRYAAVHGNLGAVMTAVVVDGPSGKEYRRPTAEELTAAEISPATIARAFKNIPFGLPIEVIPVGGSRSGGGSPFTPPQYGLTRWIDIFTPRQLLVLAGFVEAVRSVSSNMAREGYPTEWREAVWALLALAVDRIADRSSSIAHWDVTRESIANTFSGFRLPISWDFCESSPTGDATGSFSGQVEWIARTADQAAIAEGNQLPPAVTRASAMTVSGEYDAIITDPPYYDAIPYSDLMDFFYVWLRRSLYGMSSDIDSAFAAPLGPKWDHEAGDGELIDDASRFGGDKGQSKKNFEDGMALVFRQCHAALVPNGILVIVFANKNPDAWETLVAALIRAGFVVDGSLPIQTEMGNRTRAQSSAALSSSVWLVCRKRPSTARPGFAGPVLTEMREKIRTQMHRFWDAGIRGPDFVWAATGPALEAYSRHPVVRRETSTSGIPEILPVAEFLREVRRLVVDFAVGRVLKPSDEVDEDRVGLDDITTYYVLHRDTFGMKEAPIGACILYALSCNLKDDDLTDRFEILARTGGNTDATADEEDEVEQESEAEPEGDVESEGTGSKVRLRRWDQRRRKTLGLEGIGGRPVPMIDRVHRLMQLWKVGDTMKVNAFLDQTGLAREPLFAQLIQALIELANRDGRGDEAPILESISIHLRSRAGVSSPAQSLLI
jgi:adenine-specific DNA methylase